METVNHIQAEDRIPGLAGIIVGLVIIIMAVLVVMYDLPIPGGTMIGSEGQGVILLAFIGICAVLIGYHELQGLE